MKQRADKTVVLILRLGYTADPNGVPQEKAATKLTLQLSRPFPVLWVARIPPIFPPEGWVRTAVGWR